MFLNQDSNHKKYEEIFSEILHCDLSTFTNKSQRDKHGEFFYLFWLLYVSLASINCTQMLFRLKIFQELILIQDVPIFLF
jgi:hypothetical protein